ETMRRPSQMMKLLLTSFFGVIVGFLMGITFPTLTLTKVRVPLPFVHHVSIPFPFILNLIMTFAYTDIKTKQRYLVTFTVGYDQRKNIDAKEDNFTIMLFHYDGRASEWGKFEWSKRAIHVSIRKQTKWWYAKRFLHPDIVAPYEYIFIWDEDLGVEHFESEKYLAVVKKHGLEISQPGLEPYEGLTWEMTKKRDDTEVHKHAEERNGWGSDSNLPPCAASTTNLGVWWRVLSCGDSSVPDLFFIVVFLSSEFGRSGAVARDAFLRLDSSGVGSSALTTARVVQCTVSVTSHLWLCYPAVTEMFPP
ncbi:hypothetical protein F2Q69_00055883, partial [Brassica cretica]